MFVDPGDLQVTPHLVARGYWEIWIDRLVRRLIQPGARVIEVGANQGYYTVIMGQAVGEGGRLDSFEANPRLAALVERSADFNGYGPRTKVHAVAAGDRDGTARFAVSRTDSGGGHLALDDHPQGASRTLIEVPIVRLDDVIAPGPIDFIRIDAEGAEPLILAGAQAILDRSPNIAVCIEWALPMMGAMSDVPAFIAGLRARGFRFFLIGFDSMLTEQDDAALMALDHRDVIIARRNPLEARAARD